MNELEHSAKGTAWGKHKYIRIENGRYIYADSKGSRDASIGEIRDRLKNFKLTKSSKSSSKSSSSSKKSSEKKEGSSKSGSAKEKTATEKTSKASGSTDEKKVETSSNEYQKETKSVDEHYTELLEKLRARKNTSLLPQIRERQAMSERKKVKHMDDMYDGVILKPSMDDILEHHGIKGQKWGVRNGPPYPLKSHAGVGKPTNGGIKTKKAKSGGVEKVKKVKQYSYNEKEQYWSSSKSKPMKDRMTSLRDYMYEGKELPSELKSINEKLEKERQPIVEKMKRLKYGSDEWFDARSEWFEKGKKYESNYEKHFANDLPDIAKQFMKDYGWLSPDNYNGKSYAANDYSSIYNPVNNHRDYDLEEAYERWSEKRGKYR